VVGGDVVGGGFSPGLVAAESALGGALHETKFGPLSAEFGVRDVGAVGHGFSCGGAVVCCGAVVLSGQQVPFGVAQGKLSPGLRPVRNDKVFNLRPVRNDRIYFLGEIWGNKKRGLVGRVEFRLFILPLYHKAMGKWDMIAINICAVVSWG
jgi:hypothetical protein